MMGGNAQQFGLTPLALHPNADGSGLKFPWDWYQGPNDGAQSGSWRYENNRITDVMQVDYGSYIGGQAVKVGNVVAGGGPCAPAQIMGYAIDTGGLSRVLPLRHPVFYWLWASEITNVQHMGFIGGAQPDGPYGPVSLYARTLLTIVFTTLPYLVLTDAQAAGQEWRRFVQKRSKNVARFISMPKQAFEFNYGPAGITGVTINQSIGILISSATITYTWYQVPETYIYSTTGGSYAPNIRQAEGKVNQNSFDGYDSGTLLCESTDIDTMEAPCDPVTLGLDPNKPPRLYKVTLQFKWFEPPPANSGLYQNNGHNTEPAADGNWYGVVTTPQPGSGGGGGGGATKYQPYDFTKIFAHA
jgi:hypothetical protein